MSLSILHLLPTVNPVAGGTVEAVRQLAAAHRALGVRVEVASLDHPADPWCAPFEFPLHPLGAAPNQRPSAYGRSPRMAAWLREHRSSWSAVITHGLWQYHNVALRRAFAGFSVPYYVFPHGMLDPVLNRADPLKHWKKSLYWLLVESPLLRDARAVLFTCEKERALAAGSFWPYRCVERVCGLGIAGPEGDAAEQKARFFSAFPYLAGKRIFLFLGRLHGKKACDLLIAAFGRFLAECSTPGECHLLMAGPAASKDYLRQLMELARSAAPPLSISFPGMLGGEIKWGALHAAEAFILPSHQENFGVAIAESLFCGTPVLISDKINISGEILRDGAGMVEPDTLEGALSLLRRWAALSSGERDSMRSAARACFAARFDVARTAPELLKSIEADILEPVK